MAATQLTALERLLDLRADLLIRDVQETFNVGFVVLNDGGVGAEDVHAGEAEWGGTGEVDPIRWTADRGD